MNDLLGVTVEDLVASLKARRIRVPSDIGAFVALETCEALLRGPASVRAGDVRIAEDGTISVFAPPNSASAEEAARSVVGILATLLVAAGTGVPPVLVGLVEHGPDSGPSSLERLRDDLEATLVPLNRSAARRVLSRMIREARRASMRPDTRLDDVPEERLDEALDDLLGAPRAAVSDPDLRSPGFGAAPAALSDPFADPDEGSHPVTPSAARSATRPPAETTPSARRPAPGDVTPSAPRVASPETTPSARRVAPIETTPTGRRSDPGEEPARAVVPGKRAPIASPATGEADDAPAPKPRRGARPALDGFDDPEPAPKGGGSVLMWVLAFVVVALIGTAGVAVLRPDLVDLALGREPPPEAPLGPTPEEQAAALREHRARFGTLTVRSTPDRAQVLMFIGRGPAVARQLPTGMAYELVAIAEGRVPTRSVVPADAQWEATPEGPRYELAMQTGDGEMPADRLVLGETRLPRDALGAPSADLGSIRVITNPPGAKVYLLVGFTPQVTVANVRTDEAVELLVFLDGHALERVVVGPSDWNEAEDGSKTAAVDVILRPESPRRLR